MSYIQENNVDLALVKKEPLDNEFKRELIEGTNQYDYGDIEPYIEPYTSSSSSAWSLIVDRTLLLLQEENRNLNHSVIIKTLTKEVNELLTEVVNLFQECCSPTNPDEQWNENMIEVDGLLVNCLPCHPQNYTCHFKLNNVIPQFYNNTLFSVLGNQNEGEMINQNYMTDYPPDVDIDIKQEIKLPGIKKIKNVNIQKAEKTVKKSRVCDQCGKTLGDKKSLEEHVRVQHEKKKIYKCRQCKKSYSYRGGLVDHRKICKGPIKENRWIFWGKEEGKNAPRVLPSQDETLNIKLFTCSYNLVRANQTSDSL